MLLEIQTILILYAVSALFHLNHQFQNKEYTCSTSFNDKIPHIKKIKLIQKAGNSSEQNQTIELNGESDDTNTSYNVNVNMEQKAKNNAKQTQIGGVRNGRS